jgi:hypothetical protein
MIEDNGRFARIVEIACELARTGDYADIASIEREVAVDGFVEGAHWSERPAIRHALDKICDAKRQTPAWHQHTAFVCSLR